MGNQCRPKKRGGYQHLRAADDVRRYKMQVFGLSQSGKTNLIRVIRHLYTRRWSTPEEATLSLTFVYESLRGIVESLVAKSVELTPAQESSLRSISGATILDKEKTTDVFALFDLVKEHSDLIEERHKMAYGNLLRLLNGTSWIENVMNGRGLDMDQALHSPLPGSATTEPISFRINEDIEVVAHESHGKSLMRHPTFVVYVLSTRSEHLKKSMRRVKNLLQKTLDVWSESKRRGSVLIFINKWEGTDTVQTTQVKDDVMEITESEAYRELSISLIVGSLVRPSPKTREELKTFVSNGIMLKTLKHYKIIPQDKEVL